MQPETSNNDAAEAAGGGGASSTMPAPAAPARKPKKPKKRKVRLRTIEEEAFARCCCLLKFIAWDNCFEFVQCACAFSYRNF